MTTVDLVIEPNGQAKFIVAAGLDVQAFVARFGAVIKAGRASHVEIDPDDLLWYADLSPVGGPVLGGFPTRAKALAAEENWLRKYWLEVDYGE